MSIKQTLTSICLLLWTATTLSACSGRGAIKSSTLDNPDNFLQFINAATIENPTVRAAKNKQRQLAKAQKAPQITTPNPQPINIPLPRIADWVAKETHAAPSLLPQTEKNPWSLPY
jgi:hypothetical protein